MLNKKNCVCYETLWFLWLRNWVWEDFSWGWACVEYIHSSDKGSKESCFRKTYKVFQDYQKLLGCGKNCEKNWLFSYRQAEWTYSFSIAWAWGWSRQNWGVC